MLQITVFFATFSATFESTDLIEPVKTISPIDQSQRHANDIGSRIAMAVTKVLALSLDSRVADGFSNPVNTILFVSLSRSTGNAPVPSTGPRVP